MQRLGGQLRKLSPSQEGFFARGFAADERNSWIRDLLLETACSVQ